MGYFFSSYYSLIQDAFQYDAVEAAELLALQSGAGALCYLFGGYLADILPPKINLGISYVGLIVCGIITMSFPGYGIMKVIAVLTSVFGLGTFVSTILRFIPSLGTPDQTRRIYGYFYGMSGAIALITGTIATRITSSSGSVAGLRAIILFYSVVMGISYVGHLFIDKRSSVEKQNAADRMNFKLLGVVLKNPNTYFVIAIGLATCLPNNLTTYIQPTMAAYFMASQALIVLVTTYARSGTELICGPLTGIIGDKLGSTTRILGFSLIMSIVGLVLLLVFPWGPSTVAVIVIVMFLVRAVFSIGKPGRNSVISESRLPREARGTLVGLMFCATNIQTSVVAKIGGRLMADYGSDPTGYKYMYAGGMVILILGYIVCVIFEKRLKKAKERDAIKGQSIAWVVTLLVNGFITALPALAIGVIFPEMTAGHQFTPLFIVTYLPNIVRGLMLAGLFGLLLTSGDSYLLLLSSTIMDDVITPRVELEDKKIFYTRWISVLSAVVITVMGLYVDSIYQLFKTGGGAYGAGVFIPMILGCFWKKAHTKAINVGMLVGFLVAFVFDMFLKIPFGLDLDGCVVGGILSLFICVCGSLYYSSREKSLA